VRWFGRFADGVAWAAGRPGAFALAVLVVLGWAALGPAYEWSEGHSLFINTATTIITFWLGFLIIHTQSRDTLALQVKLSELIRATEAARNTFVGIEELTEEQLRALQERVTRAAKIPPSP